MGIETLLAVGSLAVGAFSAKSGYDARKDAQQANAAAAVEGKKAQSEQKALNFQAMAEERRAQVREERVRRARLLQGSENSGGGGSSAEFGATGALATGLATNIGSNLARAQGGAAISGYQQNAADFNTAAQQAGMTAQNADSVFNLSTSIFNAVGGASAFKTK